MFLCSYLTHVSDKCKGNIRTGRLTPVGRDNAALLLTGTRSLQDAASHKCYFVHSATGPSGDLPQAIPFRPLGEDAAHEARPQGWGRPDGRLGGKAYRADASPRAVQVGQRLAPGQSMRSDAPRSMRTTSAVSVVPMR